jgi:hypothetical protein
MADAFDLLERLNKPANILIPAAVSDFDRVPLREAGKGFGQYQLPSSLS